MLLLGPEASVSSLPHRAVGTGYPSVPSGGAAKRAVPAYNYPPAAGEEHSGRSHRTSPPSDDFRGQDSDRRRALRPSVVNEVQTSAIRESEIDHLAVRIAIKRVCV